MKEEDFAADLAQVIRGTASNEYGDAARFFANTYPTRGLKNLLANVGRRLSGVGNEVASIFRLDTSYGGGKSHGLIALCHAARSGHSVPNIDEFVDPAIIPSEPVRVAVFDGENSDPSNGRKMAEGCFAYTPWGEIAFALGGQNGYERIRVSDVNGTAPGAETMRELFGGEPVLILLDELSVYLRKVNKINPGPEQLTAFLTSLFKAVEASPNAVLVYTLAIGKDGSSSDAYRDENQFISDKMAEVDSVSARKATLLNPTEEDETIQVLRRRLFEKIDESAAKAVTVAYQKLWSDHRDSLPENSNSPELSDEFQASYPLHPEVLKTLTSKTSTLSNFQRVRGMLRLLAHTVSQLWQEQPDDVTAIHLHHIDPGYEPVKQEILTRLGQGAYTPAISNDVSASKNEKLSLAQTIDSRFFGGLTPYTSYVARTIFMHTLAFNDPLKGIPKEQLLYSVLGPAADISFIEDARKKFIEESAYLDDRPGVPMRFRAEANLSQIIRQMEDHVDTGDARAELNDRIRSIFDGKGKALYQVPFPGGPYDVSEHTPDGRPQLIIMGYDAVTIGESVDTVPELIERIYTHKGSEGGTLRRFRNNLVFVAADEGYKGEMHRKTSRRLALRGLKKPESLRDFPEHQQRKIHELEAQSEQDLAVAIQQCYRHVFYPSRARVGNSSIDLAHTAINLDSSSERPGVGQTQIVRALRELNKLRLSDDDPDSPTYVRDRTPLKNGQMTLLSLREEFRSDPALPMLVGDDVFVRGVKNGIKQGEYIYQHGDLLCGPGDPDVRIDINEDSVIFTIACAKKQGIWPREPVTPGPKPPPTGVNSGEIERKPGEDKPIETEPGSDAQPRTKLTHEGPLREALVRLWEKAQTHAGVIESLRIRIFEATDAFRLLGVVGGIVGENKTITIKGNYETRDGGTFEMEYHGPVADAEPIKEFLEPQLRAAGPGSATFEVVFELHFPSGLTMKDEDTKKLTDRLTRFVSSAAHVVCTMRNRS